MCTAVSFCPHDHYFGRNLDLEYSYQETVTVTPRRMPFSFRMAGEMNAHQAMIGMAYVADGYPLYYEATNESGLSMAGLNFPENAQYQPPMSGLVNVAPFELIPWLLGRCRTAAEAEAELKKINLVKIPFSDQLPLSPLHWLLADRERCVTVECTREGLKVYENPVGVLTNNPPFDYHLLHLSEFMGVTADLPKNRFSAALKLKPYSLGMGGMGLPGDLSSASRFIRAAFTKFNSICGDSEESCVSQFFHILSSVEQPKGCTLVREGEYEYTQYASCCNTDRGIYYYKTYDNSQLSAVDLHAENLDGEKVIAYPLLKKPQIVFQNRKA